MADGNPVVTARGLGGRDRQAANAAARQQGSLDALREAQESPREFIGRWIAEIATLGQYDAAAGSPRSQISSAIGDPTLADTPSLGWGGILTPEGGQISPMQQSYRDPRGPIIKKAVGDTLRSGFDEGNWQRAIQDIVIQSARQGRAAISTPGGVDSLAMNPPWLSWMDTAAKNRMVATPDKEDKPDAGARDRRLQKEGIEEGQNRTGGMDSASLTGERPWTTALQQLRQLEWAPYQRQIDDLRNDYLDRIGDLQNELAGYQGGLEGTNKAYGEYADDADAILRQAAGVAGEPIPEGTTEPVTAAYASIDGPMADVINRIGANGNGALAVEMARQTDALQGVITDAMQGDLVAQDQLFDLSSGHAMALANMAWKDDLYNAERSRFDIQMQIEQAIADKQKQIDAAKAEMDDSIQKIRDSFEFSQLTPDQVWQNALGSYLRSTGMSETDQARTAALWQEISEKNPQATKDYATFKKEMFYNLNVENLQRAGVWDIVEGVLNTKVEQGSPEEAALARLEAMLVTTDIANSLGKGTEGMWDLASVLQNVGADLDVFKDTGRFETINSGPYSSLGNVWKHYTDFQVNYDKYATVDPTLVEGSTNYTPDGKMAYPVAGLNWWSGGGFGYNDSDGRHNGVDIHARRGTPIVAATGGTVIKSGRNKVGGWAVTIRDSQGYTHYYAHMDQAPIVRVGDTVPVGRMIGVVGNSGNASGTKTHLHYGVRDARGNPVNPASWLSSVSTAAGTRSPDDLNKQVWSAY